ncbi:uncharacterized protein LOC111373156 [Olea europaea var. sylvestris]|uniref:uncharacterized protein LOC111373156 n=1 Tax=Olea europaea var. sylvestris TaxID=158386 RepID=UPI000C1D1F6C|nr:uncharacterized protein LOC111373156 [Olea europaea var. sylvestris]
MEQICECKLIYICVCDLRDVVCDVCQICILMHVYLANEVSPSNQTVFSVSNERWTFVVDIEQRTCTCRILQVDLLSCSHALAMRTWNAYQDSVYPVGNQEEWTVPEEVQREIVLPPNQKRSCGRPTEKRKRSSREGRLTTKCGCCGG